MRDELNAIIKKIFVNFDKDPPASIDDIRRLTILNLPEDYIEWLKCSGGGEGKIGKSYFSFWPANEILDLNEDFKIQYYLGNNSFCFASNGGGVGYIFKLNGNTSSVWRVPLGDLDWSSALKIGDNFLGAMEAALNGEPM